MAEYVIDNIVDPKSKAELESLIKKLQEAAVVANKIVIESSNVKTLKALAEAQEKYNKTINSQEVTQKRIEAMNQKMAIDAQKEIDRQSAMRDKAHKDELKRLDAEAKAQRKLAEEADKRAQKESRNVTKLRESDPGSINKLSAANAILQERLRGVNQTTADGAIKAERLRGAIDRNHSKIKEMSPDVTKQAMNIGNYGSVWDKLGGIMTKGLAIFGAGSLVFKGFNAVIQSSDAVVDGFEATLAGVTSATDVFFNAIMTGDWSNLLNGMVSAYTEGKKYAEIMQELEDRRRTIFGVAKSQNELEMEQQLQIAKNATKSMEERKAAIDKYIQLQEQQYARQKNLSKDEVNAAENKWVSLVGINKGQLRELVVNYDRYANSMAAAKDKENEIIRRNTSIERSMVGDQMVSREVVNQKAIDAEMSKLTRQEQIGIKWANAWAILQNNNKNGLIQLETVYKGQIEADKANVDASGRILKTKNKLYNEYLKDNNTYVTKLKKQEDDKKKIESDSLQWFMYINGQRQKDIEDQLSQEGISVEKQIELNQRLATERIKALEKQRDFDLKYASSPIEKGRIGQKFDIEFANVTADQQAKNDKIVADAKKKARDKELTDIEYQIEKETQLAEIKRDKAIEVNANEYLSKKITYEEYEKNKAKIEEQYAKDRLQMVIDMTKKEIEILEKRPDLSDEDRKKLEKLKADLAKMNADLAEQGIKKEDSLWSVDAMQNYYDKAKEITDAVGGLFDALTAKKIANLEAEQTKSDEIKNAELERVQKLLDSGTISQANADKQKEKIEKKAEKRTQDIEKKKAKLQYDAAMFSWKQSLAQIAIETALAVMKVTAQTGVISPFIIPGIIALGAINLAAAFANKPQAPKYKKGTDFHPGGLATVGDGGRELLRMPDGSTFLADKEMTFNAPRGMKVLKNSDTERVLSDAKGYKMQPIDIDSLVNETKTTNKLLKNIAQKPTINRIFVSDNSRYNQFKA